MKEHNIIQYNLICAGQIGLVPKNVATIDTGNIKIGKIFTVMTFLL